MGLARSTFYDTRRDKPIEEARLTDRVEKLGYDTPRFAHPIHWHAVGLGRISEPDSMIWRRAREFSEFET